MINCKQSSSIHGYFLWNLIIIIHIWKKCLIFFIFHTRFNLTKFKNSWCLCKLGKYYFYINLLTPNFHKTLIWNFSRKFMYLNTKCDIYAIASVYAAHFMEFHCKICAAGKMTSTAMFDKVSISAIELNKINNHI